MKKQYIKPVTEGVHVKLCGSVLGAIGDPVIGSVIDEGLGKQDDFDWDDDSFTPDLWGDDEEDDF